jgi:hypothetical protein
MHQRSCQLRIDIKPWKKGMTLKLTPVLALQLLHAIPTSFFRNPRAAP